MVQPIVVTPEHADRITPGASLAVRLDPATSALLGVDWDGS